QKPAAGRVRRRNWIGRTHVPHREWQLFELFDERSVGVSGTGLTDLETGVSYLDLRRATFIGPIFRHFIADHPVTGTRSIGNSDPVRTPRGGPGVGARGRDRDLTQTTAGPDLITTGCYAEFSWRAFPRFEAVN